MTVETILKVGEQGWQNSETRRTYLRSHDGFHCDIPQIVRTESNDLFDPNRNQNFAISFFSNHNQFFKCSGIEYTFKHIIYLQNMFCEHWMLPKNVFWNESTGFNWFENIFCAFHHLTWEEAENCLPALVE